MKKNIWILAAVAVVLCVFLAACGGNDDNAGTDLGAENFSAPLHDQLYDIPGDKEQDDEHEDGVDVQQGDEHP